MPVLCLDYGERYVGVAITDADDRVALRHSVIDQHKQDALAVVRGLVTHERITKILVGVPIGLSGQETDQTLVSRGFIEKVRDAVGSVTMVEETDETLTSVEAARTIALEGGKKEDEHMEAARLMLAEYLMRAGSAQRS
jgi:putative Holliday junction resolvase